MSASAQHGQRVAKIYGRSFSMKLRSKEGFGVSRAIGASGGARTNCYNVVREDDGRQELPSVALN